MKNIGIILRKELYRVFSDKKMVIGLFIMPAVVVIGLYLLMGVMTASMMSDIEAHTPTVLVYRAPQSFYTYLSETGIRDSGDYVMTMTEEASELEAAKDQIYRGDLDVLIVFPETFETQVAEYGSGDEIPDIQTYYNPSEDYSDNAHTAVLNEVLEPYRKQLLSQRIGSLEQLEVFTVDKDNKESVIQNDNKAQGKIFGYIIPYMITILLFAGAMNLGSDSFAGEKERGTMATLLMLPLNRSVIVYGKLFALMILSGLSALIYGGAMIFALPLLYRTLGSVLGQNLSFSAGQMAMLLVLIVTMVFLYVALIAVFATLAKNTKEGGVYITPIYMIVMVIGVLSMFQGDHMSTLQYLIPLYGPTMALKNVFTLDITGLGFVLATLSNLGTGAFCAWITARLFQNERVMFNA